MIEEKEDSLEEVVPESVPESVPEASEEPKKTGLENHGEYDPA